MPRLLPFLLILVFYSCLSLAQPPTANSTKTEVRVGWVPPVEGRGTSNILWSCLSVFLVCSWKCVHLNIPSLEESRWRRWPGMPKSAWRNWGIFYWPAPPLLRKWTRQVKWMAITVVAPELGVVIAFADYVRARRLVKEVGWEDFTMTHAYYSNMGGFVLRCDVETCKEREDRFPSNSGYPSNPNQKGHGEKTMSSNAGLPVPPSADVGHSETDRPASNGDPSSNLTTKVDAEKGRPAPKTTIRYYLLEPQEIGKLKNVLNDHDFPTKEDIQSLSKTDAFTKAFAIGQSGWLTIQCIIRVIKDLALSQLELATMAYILCALVMYRFWWEKPFGVEHRITITCPGGMACIHPSTEETPQARTPDSDLRGAWRFISKRKGFANDLKFLGVLNRMAPPLTLLAAGLMFAAIHISAWNWVFPSPVTRTLWRVFSVFAAGFPPMGILIAVLLGFVEAHARKAGRLGWFCFMMCMILPFLVFVMPVVIALIFAYLISRAVLLVLVFYCFSSMPASVYETVRWTEYLPFFS